MWVDEIWLEDPGQDGPAWTWTGPGFPPEVAEHERRKFAQQLLKLQKQFCLSSDPVHALRVQTLCQIYHTHKPPWAESVLSRLAWSAIMAPTVIRGRRLRQTHWIRFAAVNEHLRQQREAGVKRLNRELAYGEVSAALRGQPGRGAKSRIGASYLKVAAAIRRGEVDQYKLGSFDNRYLMTPLGKVRTTTALSSSPNPSTVKQPVTFTATVTAMTTFTDIDGSVLFRMPPARGSGTPTGTVTFTRDVRPVSPHQSAVETLGTGTLNASGQATFTASSAEIGSRSITAVYGGDSNFTGSFSLLTQIVQ